LLGGIDDLLGNEIKHSSRAWFVCWFREHFPGWGAGVFAKPNQPDTRRGAFRCLRALALTRRDKRGSIRLFAHAPLIFAE
jgi:hypothetical protein